METERVLLERRSIRAYLTDKPVEREKLDKVLKAGAYSPTAMNNHDRQFIAITSKSLLDRLNEIVEEISDEATVTRIKGRSDNGEFNFFYGAPVLIVVASKADGLRPISDSAVALENMFLQAYDLGLGSCWINQLTDKTEIPQIKAYLTELGLKEGYAVYGCCALGYGAVEGRISKPKASEIIIV